MLYLAPTLDFFMKKTKMGRHYNLGKNGEKKE